MNVDVCSDLLGLLGGLGRLTLLDEVPVVDVVQLETALGEEILEQCSQVGVVRLLVETKVPNVC